MRNKHLNCARPERYNPKVWKQRAGGVSSRVRLTIWTERPEPEPSASSTWERLGDFVREHVQQFIQALLEEEVTELLGRTKSERREAIEASPGDRNGRGKPRRLALTSGNITGGRARRRGLEERVVRRLVPLF